MGVKPGDSFDAVAELYDRARPSYPDELVDDLVAALPGPRVLEIACGTGKLTRQLVARGVDITGVEPGANLAAIAARSAPVTIARFEDWEPDGTYDAVCCATAWHWLDHDIATPKVHELLRPHGVLAVIGTHHVFPPDADPFFRAIQGVYNSLGEATDEFPDVDDIRHDDAVGIRATGLFDVEDRGYLRVIEYTAETYIDVLNTYSGHIAMPEEQRQTLFEGVRGLVGDGTIRKHHLFCLHLARRIG
jgi:SAM-dependent methyltransferase